MILIIYVIYKTSILNKYSLLLGLIVIINYNL